MATCSIFANPIIDTEEGAKALADAYDRFLEEEAKNPPEPVRAEPGRFKNILKILAEIDEEKV